MLPGVQPVNSFPMNVRRWTKTALTKSWGLFSLGDPEAKMVILCVANFLRP